MMISTFGVPSAFTQWGIHVIRTMADVVLGEIKFININKLDELRESWSVKSTENLFFFSNFPDRGISNVFLRSNVPVLVLMEELDDVAKFLVRERSMEYASAARLAAQCAIMLHEICGGPNTQILRRADVTTLIEFCRHASQAIGLNPSDEDYNQILIRLGVVGKDTTFEETMLGALALARPIGHRDVFAPNEQDRVLIDLLDQYGNLFVRKGRQSIVWNSELFYIAEPLAGDLGGMIELVGPGRCLTYGPYLPLPVGIWSAALRFKLKNNISGNTLIVDVVSGGVISKGEVLLPAEGEFDAVIEFEIVKPNSLIEIRTFIKYGAIEGELEIIRMTLSPVDQINMSFQSTHSVS